MVPDPKAEGVGQGRSLTPAVPPEQPVAAGRVRLRGAGTGSARSSQSLYRAFGAVTEQLPRAVALGMGDWRKQDCKHQRNSKTCRGETFLQLQPADVRI